MRFEHQFSVDAPAEKVWQFLMDVPQMAGCIPGATEIKQLDEQNYEANVTAKIGPITAKFGCRIAILDLDPAARTASVELTGKDARLGGGIKGKMTMSITESAPDQSLARIVSEVDVLGKIGQYGHGMISKRADAMLDDFASCVRSRLA